MGYYADGNGSIDFARILNSAERDRLNTVMSDTWFEYDLRSGLNRDYVDFWTGEKYHDDLVMNALNELAKIAPILDGYLKYIGEDGENWKFEFLNGEWVERNGLIVYDGDGVIASRNRAEFLGQIIDVFEDFLESKGIDIPNEDRDQSENPAILYGMDYGVLQSGIEGVMVRWNIFSAV